MNLQLNKKRRVGKSNLRLDSYGFGCASVGNLYQSVDEDQALGVLDAAWEAGFRYFDTAPHYGQGLSERRVGDSLRKYRGQDYIISTKVGRLLRPAGYADERHGFVSTMPFDIEYDYSYDGVMRSYEDSLQRLGLDRIDILYIHDIGRATHGDRDEVLFKDAMQGGYKALSELRSSGDVAAIGLGVNESEVCIRALDHGDWDCFLLAGRYTLLEQDSLDTIMSACLQRECSVVIGGAYNSGILATGVKSNRTAYFNYAPAPNDVVEKVRMLESFCDEYNIPLAAAALQFPLAHPAVVSVIPGIGKIKRVQQKCELANTVIPLEFWRSLRNENLIHVDSPLPEGV